MLVKVVARQSGGILKTTGQRLSTLCRFTCDWDPPAGHEWAGYPIRSENAATLRGATKVNDPKKQRREIRPEAGLGQEDSAPDAQQREEAGAAVERRSQRRKVGASFRCTLIPQCGRGATHACAALYV